MEHDGCYQKSWNQLYTMYNRVAHKKVKVVAKRKNVRPLDLIESANDLELLKILAEKLFVKVAA